MNYTSKFTFERQILRRDNDVPFCVEGYFFFITVEELYEWIEHYREPGKEYGIGECEDDDTLAYALLLSQVFGINKTYVRARITPSEVRTTLAGIAAELELYTLPPRGDDVISEDEEERQLINLFKSDLSRIEKAQRAEEQFEEVRIALKNKINFGNIDFSQFEELLQEEDDFPDSDYGDGDLGDALDEDLPYEEGLHTSNDEFLSLVQMGILEPQEDTYSEVSDADSEDMAPNRLTPLEALGIDLIDPSRDNTLQPHMRRIGLVWDPGGGRGPIRLRGGPRVFKA